MKDYYDIKKVSNSSLSWFQISAKFFKLKLDKELEEEKEPSYFRKGRHIHEYLLEPKEFDKHFTFLDYNIPRSKQQKDFCESYARQRKDSTNDKLLRAYNKAYSTKDTDEKIIKKAKILEKDFQDYIKYIKIKPLYVEILSNSELLKLNEIRTEVLAHKKAKDLLYNEIHNTFGNSDKLFIQNELQIQWKHLLNTECKSMLDRIIIDHEKKTIQLIDLKTTSNLSEFKESFEKFKYYRQMAFYWLALHWYFENELHLNINEYKNETYIIAISTIKPTEIKVFKISNKQLANGFNEIDRLMIELSWHFKNDKWDYSKSYYEGEGIETI